MWFTGTCVHKTSQCTCNLCLDPLAATLLLLIYLKSHECICHVAVLLRLSDMFCHVGGKYSHTASRVDTGKHRSSTAHASENDMQEALVAEMSGHHTPSSQGSQAASTREDPS